MKHKLLNVVPPANRRKIVDFNYVRSNPGVYAPTDAVLADHERLISLDGGGVIWVSPESVQLALDVWNDHTFEKMNETLRIIVEKVNLV